MIFRDEETQRAWEALHDARTPAAISDVVRAHLPVLEGRHVLQLFSGHGRVTAELLELGALVTALDDIEDAASATRERAPDAAALHADPHDLPLHLRRSRFDVVLALDVLDRVRDLATLLAGAASALRVGGVLVIADAHPASTRVDPIDLRWREDYFEQTTLGAIVTAIAEAGLLVRSLHEAPSDRRRLDRRIPGLFVLVATKP